MAGNVQEILNRIVEDLKVSSHSNVYLRSSHATLCFSKSHKLVDPMEEANCFDMKAKAVASRMTERGERAGYKLLDRWAVSLQFTH